MPTWIDPATGCTLNYDDTGSGNPIVLIHAFPLCREMWEGQREALRGAFRVLTPDVWGFGGSGLPESGWSVDAFADTCASWLTALGIAGPVVFGGLSMGGYLALAFARRHAQRVRGLILADTRADADSPETQANRNKTIEFVQQNSAAAQIERMLPNMLSSYSHQHRTNVLEQVRRIGSAQSVPGVVAALAALRDRPDSTPALGGFRFPVLLVYGLDDTLTPPTLGNAIALQLNDATEEHLPSAGHLPNLEVPDAFNTALTRWLNAIH